MNAADFRRAIKDAAAYAKEREPKADDRRAGCFVAALAGLLEREELAVAEIVWGLISTDPLQNDPPADA